MKVEQSSGGCHEYIHALAQAHHLRIDRYAAEDDRGAQFHILPVGRDAVLDLRREFAGRREDECAGTVTFDRRAVAESLQQGQGEARGLAGAGLRRAHDVRTFQDWRDRLRLDWCWRGVAGLADSAQQGFGEAEFIKFCQVSTFL